MRKSWQDKPKDSKPKGPQEVQDDDHPDFHDLPRYSPKRDGKPER